MKNPAQAAPKKRSGIAAGLIPAAAALVLVAAMLLNGTGPEPEAGAKIPAAAKINSPSSSAEPPASSRHMPQDFQESGVSWAWWTNASQKPVPPALDPGPRIRIAAAGDVMLQRRCNRSAAERSRGEENSDGYDELFQGIGDALQGADVALANIEFPVFEESQFEQELIFHGTAGVLNALGKSGFTVLNGANNHSYDHGPQSPASTAGLCREAGLACVGVGKDLAQAQSPHMVEKNGVRLAVIGFTVHHNYNYNSSDPAQPRVNGYEWEDLLSQVRTAAASADGVVVTLHWGDEYRIKPLEWQPGDARELAEAGATLVFGHHTHMPGPVELIETSDGRRVLVAYSLGNLLSNQADYDVERLTRLGVILIADLVMAGGRLMIDRWDSVPTWVYNADREVDGEVIEDVHVEVPGLRISSLEERLSGLPDGEEKTGLLKQIGFYRQRIATAEKIMRNPRGEMVIEGKGLESVIAAIDGP